MVFQPINAGAICGFLRGFHRANDPTMGLAKRDHDSGERGLCLLYRRGALLNLGVLII